MALRSFIREYAPSPLLQIYRSLLLGAKKVLPTKWVIWYFNHKKAARFRGKSGEEVFTDIYNNSKLWGSNESVSGSGSTIAVTKTLVKELDLIISELNISNILDIPCGDFNWMKTVALEGVNYVGGDIVKDLIEDNQSNYAKQDNLDFRVINLLEDDLPQSDLVFIRDCFVHFSFEDVMRGIDSIIRSGSKYLMTTTFPKTQENYDIVTGGWRSLNFQLAPFNFPDPVRLVSENYKSFNGEYEDKAMGIYLVEDIKTLFLTKSPEVKVD